jgi:hypothetical protein
VRRFAPLVRLDSRETLWPIPADAFIAESRLEWSGDRATTVLAGEAEPLAAAKLSGSAAPAYAAGGHHASEHTRPFDGHRSPSLAETDGFFLALRDRDARVGNAPAGAGCEAPVYYEWDEDARNVTYWFCYAGSAAPMGLDVLAQRLDSDAAPAADGELLMLARPDDSVAHAALSAIGFAYPGLVDEPLEELDLRFDAKRLHPLELAHRAIERLRSYLHLAAEFPFMHEGDWERVTAYYEPPETLLGVVYYEHHGAGFVPASKLEVAGGHPVVYSAWGSHASSPTMQGTLDLADGAGPIWPTWKSLEDVHRDWFGFGGAWGALGAIADATGPLGPSPWKPAATVDPNVLFLRSRPRRPSS